MNESRGVAFRDSRLLAYVLPFATFMVLGSLETWEALADYYPWVYTIKISLVLAAWWFFRRQYPPMAAGGLGLAVLVGIVGVVVWIGLCSLDLESKLFGFLPAWLLGGERAAYNPFEAISHPAGRWAFLAVRMTGLAVVVPLMEEVFWRGFLIRYLVSEDFESVPTGRYTPLSFGVVTILFAVAHPEFIAALVWCAGVNLLLYRTKNLWACIVAHATTNFLLGVYILVTKAWSLW